MDEGGGSLKRIDNTAITSWDIWTSDSTRRTKKTIEQLCVASTRQHSRETPSRLPTVTAREAHATFYVAGKQ
eukprot:IDg11148t1